MQTSRNSTPVKYVSSSTTWRVGLGGVVVSNKTLCIYTGDAAIEIAPQDAASCSEEVRSMSTPFDQAEEEAREAYQSLQAARRNLAQTRYNHSRDSSSVVLGYTPAWTTEEESLIRTALESVEATMDATFAALHAVTTARVRWQEEGSAQRAD
jgi:hypothetical protein